MASCWPEMAAAAYQMGVVLPGCEYPPHLGRGAPPAARTVQALALDVLWTTANDGKRPLRCDVLALEVQRVVARGMGDTTLSVVDWKGGKGCSVLCTVHSDVTRAHPTILQPGTGMLLRSVAVLWLPTLQMAHAGAQQHMASPTAPCLIVTQANIVALYCLAAPSLDHGSGAVAARENSTVGAAAVVGDQAAFQPIIGAPRTSAALPAAAVAACSLSSCPALPRRDGTTGFQTPQPPQRGAQAAVVSTDGLEIEDFHPEDD